MPKLHVDAVNLLALKMSNYFAVFDLPVLFDLNIDQLDKIYFSKSIEMQSSQGTLAMLNQAYKTIKNPLTRVEHIVQFMCPDEGIDDADMQEFFDMLIDDEESIAQSGSDLGNKYQVLLQELYNSFACAVRDGDLTKVRTLGSKIKYCNNMVKRTQQQKLSHKMEFIQ